MTADGLAPLGDICRHSDHQALVPRLDISRVNNISHMTEEYNLWQNIGHS